MASAGPGPNGPQPTPQQMAQMAQMQAALAAEAKKHGMTPQQFQQHIQEQQRKAFEAEAAKRGMTPQQFQEQQKKAIEEESAKAGLSPAEYIQRLRQQQMQQAQMQQKMQQQGQQPQQPSGQPQLQPQGPQQVQQQIPINPGMQAKPEALALAKFLRGQNLKTRTCILDGQRRDMFKVKRAARALQSPAYEKARKKNPLLPEVKDDATARQAIQHLPLNMLALRVEKIDPHEGHDHAKSKKDPKRTKGLWTVRIERNQEFEPMMHYAWLYEGPQWKQKAMAAGVLIAIIAVVMFPLWPLMLRQGVWYLSVGMMGLIGLFFAMALVRLILFCVTVFVVPPGLWLYPNLFEDVGFFDSFKPLWGWHEDAKAKKEARKAKKAKRLEKAQKSSGAEIKSVESPATAMPSISETPGTTPAPAPTSTPAAPGASSLTVSGKHQAPQVEEAEEE